MRSLRQLVFLLVSGSNLSKDVHESQLEQVFRSIGPITDIHLMRTSDGKSRGMGHVTFQHLGEYLVGKHGCLTSHFV